MQICRSGALGRKSSHSICSLRRRTTRRTTCPMDVRMNFVRVKWQFRSRTSRVGRSRTRCPMRKREPLTREKTGDTKEGRRAGSGWNPDTRTDDPKGRTPDPGYVKRGRRAGEEASDRAPSPHFARETMR